MLLTGRPEALAQAVQKHIRHERHQRDVQIWSIVVLPGQRPLPGVCFLYMCICVYVYVYE
jgi:hypothetical protein